MADFPPFSTFKDTNVQQKESPELHMEIEIEVKSKVNIFTFLPDNNLQHSEI